MLEFDTKVKKWGNSLGIVIPKLELKQNLIRENEILHFIVVRKNKDIKNTFGILKFKKSAQKIKDEIRDELYD